MSKNGSAVLGLLVMGALMTAACGGGGEGDEYILESEGKADHSLLMRADGQYDLVGNDVIQAVRCGFGSDTCGVLELTNSSSRYQNLHMAEFTLTGKTNWVMLFTLPPDAQVTIHGVPDYTWFGTVASDWGEAHFQINFPHKDAPLVRFNIVDPTPEPETTEPEPEASQEG